MTTHPWYPFYWSDYTGKTYHLTQGQHGAYMLLLRHIYTTGQPIRETDRYLVTRATCKEECENVDFVLGEFFVEKNGLWYNEKATEVMRLTAEKHKKRVISGAKGGKAKASNARAKPEHSSSNALLTTTITIDKITPIVPLPDTDHIFEEFWKVYPRKVNKVGARKSWAAAAKKVTSEKLVDAAAGYAKACMGKEEKFILHAATWLNQERWDDPILEKPKPNFDGEIYEKPEPWGPSSW
jgi:uncharacterized protein YdaU (DUF1376 family)